jgi:hypothetical protein
MASLNSSFILYNFGLTGPGVLDSPAHIVTLSIILQE